MYKTRSTMWNKNIQFITTNNKVAVSEQQDQEKMGRYWQGTLQCLAHPSVKGTNEYQSQQKGCIHNTGEVIKRLWQSTETRPKKSRFSTYKYIMKFLSSLQNISKNVTKSEKIIWFILSFQDAICILTMQLGESDIEMTLLTIQLSFGLLLGLVLSILRSRAENYKEHSSLKKFQDWFSIQG